jgi:hypothetical protein
MLKSYYLLVAGQIGLMFLWNLGIIFKCSYCDTVLSVFLRSANVEVFYMRLAFASVLAALLVDVPMVT